MRNLLLILALALPLSAATYYVSNTGSDAANGTSTGTPWQTVAKVNAQTFSAGDSILFQAGGTWREQLTLASSGSSGSPITFGSYGSGALPIITGANVFSSWTSETATEPVAAVIGGASGACGVSSTVLTCTAAISTSGSLLIAYVLTLGNESVTVSDAKGNTIVPITTSEYVGGNGWVRSYYVSANNGSGSDVWTMTPASSDQIYVTILEWTGQVSSSPLDGHNQANVQSGGTLNSGASSGSSSNTTDLVIGQFIAGSTITKGASFTSMDTYGPFGVNELLEQALGAGNAAANATQSSSTNWGGQVVTFKAAGLLPTIYYAPYSTAPAQVFRNGARLTQASSKAALVSGDWWLDTADSRIYVYDNPSGQTMEASQRAYGFYSACNNNSYITVSGLQVQMAQTNGIYACNGGSGSNFLVTGVTSNNNFLQGVRFDGPSNSTISYSTVAYNGTSGIDFDNTAGLLVDHDIAHDNVAITGGLYSAGIKGNDDSLGSTNVIIQNSTAYSNGAGQAGQNTGSGIWIDTIGAGALIRDNTIYSNNISGINIDADNGEIVSYNLVFSNGGAGIQAYADAQPSMTGNLFYNNTVWNNQGGGIQLSGPFGSASGGCMSNKVVNNIAVNTVGGSNLAAFFGCENPGADGSGNVYLNNAFGAAGTNFLWWAGSYGAPVYYSTYSSWEAAAGNCGTTGCSHSVQSSPSFVNTGAGNFTLGAGSPAIAAGANLGSAYSLALSPTAPSQPYVLTPQCSPWNAGAFGQANCSNGLFFSIW